MKTLTRGWVALLWALAPLIAHAQAYPYFPPPNMTYNATTGVVGLTGATLATCAANQVVYDSASAQLICSTQLSFASAPAALQIGAAGGTTAAIDLYAASAAADAHKTRVQVASNGFFSMVPVNDAGTVTAGNEFSIGRAGSTFTGFDYKDTGQGVTFSLTGNDLVFRATANSQPVLLVQDPGTADALSGAIYYTGNLAGNEFAQYCAGPAFSLGAGLTNGPTTNFCQVSSGDQLFANGPSNAPLIFGAHGIYYGQLDVNGNWVLDGGVSHATSDTNGFTYLGKTAGVPTGVPANLTGFYGTSVPLRYDSTDNRLYAYNAGWQNVSATTGGANPSAVTGLTAVNGTAATYVRSDGAPALSLAIAPNLASPWTASPWDWSNAEPRWVLTESDQGADLKNWDVDVNAGVLAIRTRTDADGAGVNVMTATRGTTTAITAQTMGNTTSNPSFTWLGTGNFSVTGGATFTSGNTLTVGKVSVSNGSPAANGIYLAAANTLGFSANTTGVGSWSTTTLTLNGALNAPNLATSSAATTGTLCWSTGTGLVNVDTTTTCLLSSRRYKQAIEPLEGGLAEVLRLRPVSYQLRPQYDPQHLGRQVGLIAEDVGAVDDRLISHEPDGRAHAVRYQQLTAVLVKALQDQQREIAQLQTDVQQLRTRSSHADDSHHSHRQIGNPGHP